MEKRNARFYINGLLSTKCACGRPKDSGKSFCYRCFAALPPDMGRDLYKRMGEGYEDAYDAAFKWLKERGWGPKSNTAMRP